MIYDPITTDWFIAEHRRELYLEVAHDALVAEATAGRRSWRQRIAMAPRGIATRVKQRAGLGVGQHRARMVEVEASS